MNHLSMLQDLRTCVPPARLSRRLAAGALALLALAVTALATGGSLAPDQATRIADPKLRDAEVEIGYSLTPAGAEEQVVVELLDGTTLVHTIFDGMVTGSDQPIQLLWDGRGAGGVVLDVGDYTLRVRLASGTDVVDYPLSIVRLGFVEIEAHSTGYTGPGGDVPRNEWQMVYFKKGTAIAYYATPATGEYVRRAESFEVSDLDYNSGLPKAMQRPHRATDEPAMQMGEYDTNSFNYPLCYLAGARPCFEVTFGSTATTAGGVQQGVNYPVAGYDIRCSLSDGLGPWITRSTAIQPDGTAIFYGPPLPVELARQDRRLTWTWQYRAVGGTEWSDVPGSFTTIHRFYTVIGEPNFANGVTGTRYVGPWVEVADYVTGWARDLSLSTTDQHEVISALILGFFGQQGPLTTAIEGVVYDCYPMGGDGGASHYFDAGAHRMDLSALLNGHANGKFLNCSDCAGATSTMAAMIGIDDVLMVHLGNMSLKAIWGIGCPAYTTNLWGSGHGFSYHHIITRTAAVEVCDACMCLDEDGNPGSTPGVPGYNCDRPWAGPSGYDVLSSYNTVSKYTEALPKLK